MVKANVGETIKKVNVFKTRIHIHLVAHKKAVGQTNPLYEHANHPSDMIF